MSGSTISFKIIVDSMLAFGCEVVVLVSNRATNRTFIQYLVSAGCTVETFDDEKSVYPECQLIGWTHSFVKFPWRIVRKLYRLFRSNRQVSKLIIKHAPDLVHTNVGVFQQGVRACERFGIPHVWHLREYQTKDFGLRILPSTKAFKRLLRTTNVVTITNDILEYFDLKNISTARAIWNGILPAGSAVYLNDKKPYFLCANRVSPEKEIEIAIEAFGIVAERLPGYRLLIVGEFENDAYLQSLHKMLAESPFRDRIVFEDYRPDVVNLMKESTALIVASKFEGLGRMSVEATFMGSLVLGRNTGGTREVLTATGGGYLFNSTEELALQMLKVAQMAGTDAYKTKVLAAQRVAICGFSNEQYFKSILDLYNDVIDGSKH